MAASTPPRDASQLTELALLSEHYWTDRRALLPVLGAYLPRFGDGSPLSALPKEVLQHIARLAYRPRLKPKFEIPGDNVLLREYVEKFGREPTINLHDEHYLLNGGHKQCHPYGVDSARKLEFDFPEDFQYIELSFYRWCGTRLAIGDWELEFTVFDHGESHIVELSRAASDGDFFYGHVKAWDGVWKNDGSRDDELVALLFDPTGAVHVAVNGVAALSLPLPQREAIKIKLWDTDIETNPGDVCADTVTFPTSVPSSLAVMPGHRDHPDPTYHGYSVYRAVCDSCEDCQPVWH